MTLTLTHTRHGRRQPPANKQGEEDRERIEEKLADAVERFNAATDPSERVELIHEVRRLRSLLLEERRCVRERAWRGGRPPCPTPE